jgi:fatty-acyl-CoA synthase
MRATDQSLLSYAHGAATAPLLGETIGANLERTIARVPDAEALVSCHQGVRYTYAEFGDTVDLLAGGMLAAGLRRGDRVGVWGPNRSEWGLVQYATAKLGVILVNINPAYRTNELEYALRQSGCRLLFAAKEVKGSDFVAMVDQVSPKLPELERAIFFETPAWEEIAAGGHATMSEPRCGRCSSTSRSTSSTRAAPPASPRERRSPTTTSSTTATFSHSCSPTPSSTASASRSPCTTASGW